MRRKAKKSKLFLILILVLGISVGYAALSKTLRINGTSSIKKSSWIIYFDNIRNESGVTAATQTTISNDKTEVNFKISIDKPGDFYEFDVDTVNDGSIDAMIESVELNGIKEENKSSFSFTTTYEDGTELKSCDILQAGTRKKVKVRFNYSKDIEISDLLDEEEKMNLQFKINYVQNTTCENKVVLNIDPNGGKYNNLNKITKISLDKNTTYKITEIPKRSGYIFKYWETEDGEKIEKDEETNSYTINITTKNITIKAIWEQDLRDYVARINDDYYETIQDAIDSAVANDEIHLLKNTTESPTNNKKVVLNLEDFTVTGTLTNTTSGDIVLKNGTIKSDTISVINNGVVTLGVKDGNYEIDDIILEGETIGLKQNNNFYFYDGHIIALQGIDGGCNEKEENYYIYVDKLKKDDIEYQKVYLTDEPSGVAMTINGAEFYFQSLQYAVAATDNLHPTVYIIKDFESSAEVNVSENQILVLDMNGHTLTDGAAINNNGNLTITDSKEEKGSFEISLPITNNNTLNISNAVINQTTTSGNIIENNKDINIVKSTLKAKSGSVIYNKTAGTIELDDNTTLTSSGYAFNNNADGTTTLKGGNVFSINEQKGTLELENVTVNSTKNNAINIAAGTLKIKSGNYHTTEKELINKESGNLIVDGGNFTVDYSNNYSYIGSLKNGSTTINGGTFNNLSTTTNYGFDLYRDELTMNGGTIQSNSTTLYSNDGPIVINDGTITSKTSYCINTYTPVTINGGTIHSDEYYTLSIGEGSVINGGNISSRDSYALYIMRNAVTMTGGTLTSDSTAAVYVPNERRNQFIITGGTIKGKTYGIQSVSETTIVIGENKETLDITKPVVEGELVGVYIGGSISFYDGILKGKTAGYQGTIDTKRAKHIVTEGEEVRENGDVYKTAYLVQQENFLKTDDNEEFNSLQEAIDHIGTTGTITVTKDATYTDTTSIPNTKTITLKLDGHTLNLTKQISNKGKLTIDGTKENSKMTSIASYMIENTNSNPKAVLNINGGTYEGNEIASCSYTTLNITDGVFKGTNVLNIYNSTVTIDNADITGSTAGIYVGGDSSNVTINNAKINYTGKNAYSAVYVSRGTVIINDGEFTAQDDIPIKNYSYSTTTINGGKFTANNYYAILNGGTININGGTITSSGSYALHNYKTCNINGGTIKSETNHAIYNYRSDSRDNPVLTITDGTIIGKKDGIYTEEDKVNPMSVYGKTKYLGEEEVRRNPNHYITRISWVFGVNGNNFIKTMLRLADKYPELKVVNDQVGSPTYTVDLAKLLVEMAETDKYGTYHVNNEGYCSWAEFAKYIMESNGKKTIINPVTTEEYYEGKDMSKIAYRPRNSKLDKSKLEEAGFKRLPSWQDATDRYCKQLTKSKKWFLENLK